METPCLRLWALWALGFAPYNLETSLSLQVLAWDELRMDLVLVLFFVHKHASPSFQHLNPTLRILSPEA